MANVLKNFLGYLKLGEEDEYEDYIDDYEEEQSQLDRIRRERNRERELDRSEAAYSSKSMKSQQTTKRNDTKDIQDSRKDRMSRMEKTTSNKIIPIRTNNKGMEVSIMKPASFEDSQDICDMLLSGRAVVVNLEGFDPDIAQRIMDFISGAVYAINGKLHPISRYIFIFSPDSIDISGDYLDIVSKEGFGVPKLNKEF